jgi:hypothetical protein
MSQSENPMTPSFKPQSSKPGSFEPSPRAEEIPAAAKPTPHNTEKHDGKEFSQVLKKEKGKPSASRKTSKASKKEKGSVGKEEEGLFTSFEEAFLEVSKKIPPVLVSDLVLKQNVEDEKIQKPKQTKQQMAMPEKNVEVKEKTPLLAQQGKNSSLPDKPSPMAKTPTPEKAFTPQKGLPSEGKAPSKTEVSHHSDKPVMPQQATATPMKTAAKAPSQPLAEKTTQQPTRATAPLSSPQKQPTMSPSKVEKGPSHQVIAKDGTAVKQQEQFIGGDKPLSPAGKPLSPAGKPLSPTAHKTQPRGEKPVVTGEKSSQAPVEHKRLLSPEKAIEKGTTKRYTSESTPRTDKPITKQQPIVREGKLTTNDHPKVVQTLGKAVPVKKAPDTTTYTPTGQEIHQKKPFQEKQDILPSGKHHVAKGGEVKPQVVHTERREAPVVPVHKDLPSLQKHQGVPEKVQQPLKKAEAPIAKEAAKSPPSSPQRPTEKAVSQEAPRNQPVVREEKREPIGKKVEARPQDRVAPKAKEALPRQEKKVAEHRPIPREDRPRPVAEKRVDRPRPVAEKRVDQPLPRIATADQRRDVPRSEKPRTENTYADTTPVAKPQKKQPEAAARQDDVSIASHGEEAVVQEVGKEGAAPLAAQALGEGSAPVVGAAPVGDNADLYALVNSLADKLFTMRAEGQTETILSLKNNPLLQDAVITLTEYDIAQGEFNISFSNLSNAARELLESAKNQEMLKQSLGEKGFNVHIVTATHEREAPVAFHEAGQQGQEEQSEDQQGQGKKGRDQEEEEEKE